MSKITEILNKNWIDDLSEISMLENFFEDYEIKKELEEIEEKRKKRQLALVIITPTILILAMYFASLWLIDVETWWLNRKSEWFDWFWISIFPLLLAFIWILIFFHSKIILAIKQKILSKLSKKIYNNLEYDKWEKYAFNDIQKLQNERFLNSYQTIDKVEDSIAFTLNKDWKVAIIQWYELKTSEGSGKSKAITNHCYLLKIRIPNSRIKLENNLLIKTNISESFIWYFPFVIPWVILWSFLWTSIFYITNSFIIILLISPIFFWFIAYFWRKKYINSKRIKLENMEFEKMFDVICEDQIWSRMIITPAFMDRLVNFSKKSKYKYEFLFTPECFYIKWQINLSFLEITTHENITENISTFTLWYIEMKNIISLITDMQILYLSKTTDKVDNEANIEYETFWEFQKKMELFWTYSIILK